jgi:hypothetical protein
MNDPFTDFRAVMKAWPSRGALARDLELKRITVEAWWRSNSIPPRWFDAVTRAAIKRDIDGIRNEMLLDLHAKRVEEGPPKKSLALGAEA